MAAVTICSDFGVQENKLSVRIIFPSIPHEVMGLDGLIFVFWMLSFNPAFLLSSFTFIKRLFSSSWLSATSVVSSAYLRLWIFLPGILIPACASPSLAFCMMYSAYKLNKRNIRVTIYSLDVLLSQFGTSLCPFLTVASWPAYRFLRRQVLGGLVFPSLRIFQFVVIHSQGFWHSQ